MEFTFLLLNNNKIISSSLDLIDSSGCECIKLIFKHKRKYQNQPKL